MTVHFDYPTAVSWVVTHLDTALLSWLETTFLTSTKVLVIFNLPTNADWEECLAPVHVMKLGTASGKAVISVTDFSFKTALLWQIIFYMFLYVP